ncbi:hypothetical protein SAMN05216505_112219 [Streptomyces prasinopilosus]|uniref:Uncharacterized protein n=1 Tax=Streptomyces prasinopilosus TaxID=67344 RepID=A0A1G6Y7D3_9ACTN|nr:hypothetical protein SAMN05216505_112219 [Streptomyces prasinopilosus]
MCRGWPATAIPATATPAVWSGACGEPQHGARYGSPLTQPALQETVGQFQLPLV